MIRTPAGNGVSALAVATAWLVTSAATATAQCPPAPRASDTTTYLPCHTRPAPRSDSANLVPRNPDFLRMAGVSGEVRARFVVDSAGRPEMGTFRVLSSTHELLSITVRNAVRQWRYAPGRRRGRPVRVLVEEHFAFVATEDDVAEGRYPPGTGYADSDVTPDGLPRRVRTWPSRDLHAPALTVTDARAAQVAAIAAVADSDVLPHPKGIARVVCAALRDSAGRPADPSIEELAALTRPGVAAFGWRRCPPGFESMVAPREPIPPGDEPFQMNVGRVAAWATDAVLVKVDYWHGTLGREYLCLAERQPAGGEPGWRGRCRLVATKLT